MAKSDYNGYWQNIQKTVKSVKLKQEVSFQYLMAFWSYEGKL